MWYYIFILIPNIYLVDVKGEIYSITSLALTVINHSHGSFGDDEENLSIEILEKKMYHLYIRHLVSFRPNIYMLRWHCHYFTLCWISKSFMTKTKQVIIDNIFLEPEKERKLERSYKSFFSICFASQFTSVHLQCKKYERFSLSDVR